MRKVMLTSREARRTVNLVVRRDGEFDGADVGDHLDLVELGAETPFARGVAVGRARMPFRLLPQGLLAMHHSPRCRNLYDLAAELQALYQDFEDFEVVDALMFTLFN